MKKIKADTLEEAYSLAAKEFQCSITALDCEIIQYPSSGFLGLFSKQAVIVVAHKNKIVQEVSGAEKESSKDLISGKKSEGTEESKPEKRMPVVSAEELNIEKAGVSEDSIVDSFFGADNNTSELETDKIVNRSENNILLQEEIEKELKTLIELSCFDIDVVEADVIESTAYVFIDGEDAALLIGKEGYRYNALSYLISNWLQNKYSLYLKLEIAQFLASQQEMIRSYMEPVIEHVEEQGWGRTRALDGILVQIALEQLREEFPNKYVAIKRTRSGDRYVLINEFNKR